MTSIKIYTTPQCGFCNIAKDYFKTKNWEYEEFNVVTDAQRQREMIEMSGQMGVPVIQVNGQVVVGFNKSRINELMGI